MSGWRGRLNHPVLQLVTVTSQTCGPTPCTTSSLKTVGLCLQEMSSWSCRSKGSAGIHLLSKGFKAAKPRTWTEKACTPSQIRVEIPFHEPLKPINLYSWLSCSKQCLKSNQFQLLHQLFFFHHKSEVAMFTDDCILLPLATPQQMRQPMAACTKTATSFSHGLIGGR